MYIYLYVTMVLLYMGASINRGPQNRPKYIMALMKGTTKMGPLILETAKRGFPKIMGTFLGVPIIRTTVFWGLFWGCLYFGKLPYGAIQGPC